MENIKLYGLLYELKGMVKSLSDIAEYHEEYHNPMIERIDVTMNEVIQEIEK